MNSSSSVSRLSRSVRSQGVAAGRARPPAGCLTAADAHVAVVCHARVTFSIQTLGCNASGVIMGGDGRGGAGGGGGDGDIGTPIRPRSLAVQAGIDKCTGCIAAGSCNHNQGTAARSASWNTCTRQGRSSFMIEPVQVVQYVKNSRPTEDDEIDTRPPCATWRRNDA